MSEPLAIIGAGVCGIYMLHQLKKLGIDAVVLERGTGLGGTWYWNRYPGARFDSESYSYGYSFDKEILDEWDWSEHFAAQPETLNYLNCKSRNLSYPISLGKLRRFVIGIVFATQTFFHERHQVFFVLIA